jgi:hypothetical protein
VYYKPIKLKKKDHTKDDILDVKKGNPITGLDGPLQGSRRLRLPDLNTVGT